MTKGKLIVDDDGKNLVLIFRQQQQYGIWTDPVDEKEHEIQLTTVIGGKNSGCPIVEIDGHKVGWDFVDLADEAIEILRENGILPKESD